MNSFISIVSLHILHISTVFASRSAELLSTCNYVNYVQDDTECAANWPSGCYAGYFAMPQAGLSPTTPYCNVLNNWVYDDNTTLWSLTNTFSYTFECNADGTAVTRNFYYTADCTESSVTTVTEDITDTTLFNCGATSDCLMHRISYAATGEGADCVAELDKISSDQYNVNGGCIYWYNDKDTGSDIYRLEECSDCSVANPDGSTDPTGVYVETYKDSACAGDVAGAIAIPENDCTSNTAFLGYIEVTECSGTVTPRTLELGAVAECAACVDAIESCRCDADCSSLAPLIYQTACTNTAYGIYGTWYGNAWSDTGICTNTDDTQWYGTPDCEAAGGISELWDCLYTNDCLQVYAPACDCDMLACDIDGTCIDAFTTGVLDFDDGFDSLYTYCADKDCTVLQEYLLCAIACDGGWGDDGDDGCWSDTSAEQMFNCVFDGTCYPAFDAILGDIFTDDGLCETEFCSPTYLQSTKDTYCADTTNTCGDLFTTFFDTWIACFNTECPFQYCSEEIAACEEDATCYEEINYVAHIENSYHAAKDDDLFGIIKNHYCLTREGGTCSELLEVAFLCVELNTCFSLNDDQCWETYCQTEVDECAANGVCLDTLLEGIGAETTCQDAVSDGAYPLDECPDCDDLASIQPVDSTGGDRRLLQDGTGGVCGYEPTDDTNTDTGSTCTYCVEVDGEEVELYDVCTEACDACGDGFLDIAIAGCGDDACDGKFSSTLKCILPACNTDDTDDCFSTCWDEVIDCQWSTECRTDWEWVEAYDFESASFVYDSVVRSETGCSEDDITQAWTDAAALGDDTAAMAQVMQCRYYDILEYCKDTTTVNTDGCNAAFYAEANCVMQSCWGVTDVWAPTDEPTTTVEDEDPVIATTDEDDQGEDDDKDNLGTDTCDEEPYLEIDLTFDVCWDSYPTVAELWEDVKTCFCAEIGLDPLTECLPVVRQVIHSDVVSGSIDCGEDRGLAFEIDINECGHDCDELQEIVTRVAAIEDFGADLKECMSITVDNVEYSKLLTGDDDCNIIGLGSGTCCYSLLCACFMVILSIIFSN